MPFALLRSVRGGDGGLSSRSRKFDLFSACLADAVQGNSSTCRWFQVIKQSHLILSFLAMECRITTEHIDLMWAAAQLKHCGRVVQDLLPPLVKHLEATPVLHLYKLLCSLDPREHTEQVIHCSFSPRRVLRLKACASILFGLPKIDDFLLFSSA